MNQRSRLFAVFMCVGWLVGEATASEHCFFSHETTSGMNKTCVYSCPSGEASITISNVKLCPLSVMR